MSSAPLLPGEPAALRPAHSNEMPETSPQHGRAFDDNIDILFDELVLATKWGRPSVLLAVHKSRFGQGKAEKALEARLKEQGQDVVRIVVNDQRSDIAGLMLSAPPDDKRVFFVSNIDWGGGGDGRQAYRSLNLHRELFVEQHLKAVFWLTSKEAANLPRLAPDFWAFRHRVVEFISQRAPVPIRLPAGVLAWDIQKSVDPFDGLQDGILARRELLGRLPNNAEALSTRTELNYNLGYLYWLAGETENSSRALQAGLDLVKDIDLPDLKSRLLNGLGILQYEAGDYPKALERFNEGLQCSPSSASLLTNVGTVTCVLGRNQEAAVLCKKALRVNPADADSWSRCGHIFAAMGKPDQAIENFAKAAELAPRAPAHHEALAVVYTIVERPDEARRHLNMARDLADADRGSYLAILEAAILGDADQAERLLTEAVAAGRITKPAVRRDPSFGILLDPAQIEAVLA
jgi:Flp pilus assembly protein TadD